MSLAIQVGEIKEVLIGGKWFSVLNGSFSLDSYEYLDGNDILHPGGQSGICAMGFRFQTLSKMIVYGPLSSIQAVSREGKR